MFLRVLLIAVVTLASSTAFAQKNAARFQERITESGN